MKTDTTAPVTILATRYVDSKGHDYHAPFAVWFAPSAPQVVDVHGKLVGKFESTAFAQLMADTLNTIAKDDAGIHALVNDGGN